MLCPHPMSLKRRATLPTLPPPRRVRPPAQRVRSSANFSRSPNVGFSGPLPKTERRKTTHGCP